MHTLQTYCEEALFHEVSKMANGEKRSLSSMVKILLTEALEARVETFARPPLASAACEERG
jgi:hypothetical protein